MLLFVLYCLTACSVQSPIKNQYQLDCYSNKRLASKHKISLLISQPDAVVNYQTEQMLYVTKPYTLNAFVHNAWANPPAQMLFPLLIKTMQESNFFYAVSSTPYADRADYRLDTQLIDLHQNFLVKPSVLEFEVKSVVTHLEDNRVVASRIFKLCIPCPQETPYGGVIAANQAVKRWTARLTTFVISEIKHDYRHS